MEFVEWFRQWLGIAKLQRSIEAVCRNTEYLIRSIDRTEKTLSELRTKLMALSQEIDALKLSVADLTSSVAAEKTEVSEKLTALESSIADQSALISQLQETIANAQTVTPDQLAELAALNAAIVATTAEVKAIVTTPLPDISPDTSEIVGEVVADPDNELTPDEAAIVIPAPAIE